jgi:hypothetical protein
MLLIVYPKLRTMTLGYLECFKYRVTVPPSTINDRERALHPLARHMAFNLYQPQYN